MNIGGDRAGARDLDAGLPQIVGHRPALPVTGVAALRAGMTGSAPWVTARRTASARRPSTVAICGARTVVQRQQVLDEAVGEERLGAFHGLVAKRASVMGSPEGVGPIARSISHVRRRVSRHGKKRGTLLGFPTQTDEEGRKGSGRVPHAARAQSRPRRKLRARSRGAAPGPPARSTPPWATGTASGSRRCSAAGGYFVGERLFACFPLRDKDRDLWVRLTRTTRPVRSASRRPPSNRRFARQGWVEVLMESDSEVSRARCRWLRRAWSGRPRPPTPRRERAAAGRNALLSSCNTTHGARVPHCRRRRMARAARDTIFSCRVAVLKVRRAPCTRLQWEPRHDADRDGAESRPLRSRDRRLQARRTSPSSSR
jgi:hypothetical protein